MATVNPDDLFAVNRNDVTYSVKSEDLMTSINSTDYLAVNRDNVTYKITGEELIESVTDELTIAPFVSKSRENGLDVLTVIPNTTGGKLPFTYTYVWKYKENNVLKTIPEAPNSEKYTVTSFYSQYFLGCEVTVSDNFGNTATGMSNLLNVAIPANIETVALSENIDTAVKALRTGEITAYDSTTETITVAGGFDTYQIADGTVLTQNESLTPVSSSITNIQSEIQTIITSGASTGTYETDQSELDVVFDGNDSSMWGFESGGNVGTEAWVKHWVFDTPILIPLGTQFEVLGSHTGVAGNAGWVDLSDGTEVAEGTTPVTYLEDKYITGMHVRKWSWNDYGNLSGLKFNAQYLLKNQAAPVGLTTLTLQDDTNLSNFYVGDVVGGTYYLPVDNGTSASGGLLKDTGYVEGPTLPIVWTLNLEASVNARYIGMSLIFGNQSATEALNPADVLTIVSVNGVANGAQATSAWVPDTQLTNGLAGNFRCTTADLGSVQSISSVQIRIENSLPGNTPVFGGFLLSADNSSVANKLLPTNVGGVTVTAITPATPSITTNGGTWTEGDTLTAPLCDGAGTVLSIAGNNIELFNASGRWAVNSGNYAEGPEVETGNDDFRYTGQSFTAAVNCDVQSTEAITYGLKASSIGSLTRQLKSSVITGVTDGSIVSGFAPVTYTGNGGTQDISCGFAPDLVWVKRRYPSGAHTLWDSVRGAYKHIQSDTTTVEVTEPANRSLVLNGDGFAIDTSGGDLTGEGNINNNGDNYIAWCFDAGDTTVTNNEGTVESQVRSNGNFSVVEFEIPSSDSWTVGHGCDTAPSLLICKKLGADGSWIVYHSAVGSTGYLRLNAIDNFSTKAGAWDLTSPSSTVFTQGTTAFWSSNARYIAYCWADSPTQSFGSYEGNSSASAGPVIECGFEPAFVMIKCTNNSGQWFLIDSARGGTKKLGANASDAENNLSTLGDDVQNVVEFLSSGFKLLSSNNGTNEAGNTYIYVAFGGAKDASQLTLTDNTDLALFTPGMNVSQTGGGTPVSSAITNVTNANTTINTNGASTDTGLVTQAEANNAFDGNTATTFGYKDQGGLTLHKRWTLDNPILVKAGATLKVTGGKGDNDWKPSIEFTDGTTYKRLDAAVAMTEDKYIHSIDAGSFGLGDQYSWITTIEVDGSPLIANAAAPFPYGNKLALTDDTNLANFRVGDAVQELDGLYSLSVVGTGVSAVDAEVVFDGDTSVSLQAPTSGITWTTPDGGIAYTTARVFVVDIYSCDPSIVLDDICRYNATHSACVGLPLCPGVANYPEQGPSADQSTYRCSYVSSTGSGKLGAGTFSSTGQWLTIPGGPGVLESVSWISGGSPSWGIAVAAIEIDGVILLEEYTDTYRITAINEATPSITTNGGSWYGADGTGDSWNQSQVWSQYGDSNADDDGWKNFFDGNLTTVINPTRATGGVSTWTYPGSGLVVSDKIEFVLQAQGSVGYKVNGATHQSTTTVFSSADLGGFLKTITFNNVSGLDYCVGASIYVDGELLVNSSVPGGPETFVTGPTFTANGTVQSTSPAFNTMTLSPSNGRWMVTRPNYESTKKLNKNADGPTTDINNTKLYTLFDSEGNISDLTSTDPGYKTMVSGGTPFEAFNLEFPNLLPSGNTPDQVLPEGASFCVDVEASNIAGSDQLLASESGACITPTLDPEPPEFVMHGLRFDSARETYLSRTLNEGNRTTWTWTGWVKRSELGTVQRIFSGGTGGSNDDYTSLIFWSDNTIWIGGYTAFFRDSIATFTDVSSWIHIVFTADLSNANDDSKFKVWVNGINLDWTSTNSNPSFTGINSAVIHTIGSETDGSDNTCGLYLSECYFVDGQALEPTAFGYDYENQGKWAPLDSAVIKQNIE